MVNEYWFLGVLFLFGLIVVSTYRSETKNPALKSLATKYAISNIDIPKNTETQMFYFWLEGKSKRKDYINGMYIFSDDKGIYFKPTIFNLWVKEMFIPKSELVESGEMRSFFKKKQIYSVDSTGVCIAFSDVQVSK